MSDRLLSLANDISKKDIVLDVGTDHGYLPIYPSKYWDGIEECEILLICNPIACLIHEARNVLLNSTAPNILVILVWLIIGLFLCFIGIRTIYKYENTYVKVMR